MFLPEVLVVLLLLSAPSLLDLPVNRTLQVCDGFNIEHTKTDTLYSFLVMPLKPDIILSEYNRS